MLDSEDSGDHLRDVTEDPWREVSVSSVEESETERSEVDLSRVKQEVIDVDELSSKHLEKGMFINHGACHSFLYFKIIQPYS